MARRTIGPMVVMTMLSAGLWADQAVQPLEGRLSGKAGDTGTGTFLITNVLPFDADVTMSVTDLPNAGGAVPTLKENGIQVEGSPTFKLSMGESRSVNYRVIFPANFDKLAAGAISLVIRKAGDRLSTPAVNTLLPIFLQPLEKNASLNIELKQPNIHFISATAVHQGPKKVEVSFILLNTGSDPVGPRGRVDFRTGGQTMESLSLQGSQSIPTGATAVFSGMTQRTEWPDGAYEANVTFDYGDYYRQPQKLEKTYFFRVAGEMISVDPGSATPDKVAPR